MSKHGYRIPSPHSAPVLILDAPQLSVSPSVIREQGVVQLNCEPPLTGASMCYFYPERDNSDVQPAQSCQLFLTRSELKHWAGHSSTSSEPVSLVCYYTVSVSGVDKPSIHSPPAPVWILDKKPIISVDFDSQSDGFLITCEIPLTGSVSAEFKCNLYTGHLLFLNGESRRGSSGAWNCVLSTSKNDLLNRLWSVKSSEVTCDYSLNSDPTVRSPLSDPYDVSRLLPAATQSPITAEQPPEDSPGSSTHFSSTTDSTPSESPFSVSLLATNNHVTHCCQTPTDLPKTGFITASSVPELSAETTMLSPTAVNIQPNEHSVEKTSPDTERLLLLLVLSVTGAGVVVVAGVAVFSCTSISKSIRETLLQSCKTNCV
ncbi:uncharacterized protein [Hoplias malabaricus]|uniref:uncharacterized protein isoform X1 n=1 Tax=Hoplias malabaricus TaxID=27720 RepID=UPI003461F5AE